MKKSLCILMPVYEARDRVKTNIDAIIKTCEENTIDIFLCDGSSDDSIESLVKEYGSDSLHYMDKRANPARKMYDAFKTLQHKYQYIWLTSDGRIFKLEKIMEYVDKYTSMDYDIIHFRIPEPGHSDETVIREYTDVNEFYVDDVWYMTCYGASIVSSELMQAIDWEEMGKRYPGSFAYVMALYHVCADRDIRVIHIETDWQYDNPKRIMAGWVMGGRGAEVFGKNWYISNMSLPEVYDKNKPEAIASLEKNTHFFSYRNLLVIRIFDNVSLAKIKEYKWYLKKVTKTPLWYFYFVALIPKSLLLSIWKAKGHSLS